MRMTNKIAKIRKLKEIKAFFDEKIAEEEDQIMSAKLDYQFNLYLKPTPLMKRVYALCYRDSYRTSRKIIEHWQERYLQEKKRVLTDN